MHRLSAGSSTQTGSDAPPSHEPSGEHDEPLPAKPPPGTPLPAAPGSVIPPPLQRVVVCAWQAMREGQSASVVQVALAHHEDDSVVQPPSTSVHAPSGLHVTLPLQLS